MLNKINKSILNISFVSAGNIFNAAFGFLFLAAIARTLEISDYGKYALLSTLLVSIARITDFGTDSVFVAKSLSTEKEDIQQYFSSKIILFFTAIVISLGVLYFVELLTWQILVIFLMGLVAYTINFMLFALFQRVQKFIHAVSLNTIPALIKGAFAVLLFFSVIEISYITAFAIFAFSMFSSVIIYFIEPVDTKSIKVNLRDAFSLIKNSSPAGISIVITNSWQAISNTVAKIANNFTDVGVFSLPNKIANVFTLISVSIFTVLLPKNAKIKSENKTYDIKELLFLSVGILVLAFFASIISKIFVAEFFGEKFSESIALLDLLIYASAISAIHNFLENFFYIEKKTTSLMKITVSKLVIFLFISIFFIYQIGIIAIAWAQFISAVYALIATYFVLSRQIKS